MEIAIVGGTGVLGRQLADELLARGHEVRILSRKAPKHRVDLTTGEGLEAALKGCDAVVDASNNSTPKAADVLVRGCRRLIQAEAKTGVAHHVCVSVVGCDRIPMGYFNAKAQQEREVVQSPVPWSIVRATQFHNYIANMFADAARWGMLPMLPMLVQTVDVVEVARMVADVVETGPSRGIRTIGGPEIADAREMARTWRAITGKRALAFPFPLMGAGGRALRSGAATIERPNVRGETTFATWLKRGGTRFVRRAS